MRFDTHRVTTQVQLMVERWMREQVLDVSSTHAGRLSREIEGVIESYIRRFRALEDEAEKVLIQQDVNGDISLKRAVEMVAQSKSFPVYDAAFDHLNQQIEDALLESDVVDELYADSSALVAVNTPYLKAMTGRQIL